MCIFEDLLPCFYVTKANSTTIRSPVSQPAAYIGKVADLSELQAHHRMLPQQ